MSEIQVIDNFLSERDFKPLRNVLDSNIVWHYSEVLPNSCLLCDKKYNYQYVHGVWCGQPESPYYKDIFPIIQKLNVRSLIRAKFNSICREEEIVIHGYHYDINFHDHPRGFGDSKTAVFYLNTNNGFTIFEGGTKVESVANRCVIFPAHYKHSGTTCTDVHRRLALNLVYF